MLRSWKSSREATDQPSCSRPTRLAAGRLRSSKNSWQKSLTPVASRIGLIVNPFPLTSGTMIMDRPRCFGASGLVRHSSMPKSATWANVLQIFEPLTT